MSLEDSTVLYYLSHFLLAGSPTEMLERLWVTFEDGHESDLSQNQTLNKVAYGAWKTLLDNLKESWRAIGVTAALIASSAAALIATPIVSAQSTTLVLFLASITCSIMSVSTATTFLSSISYQPQNIRKFWAAHGQIFVIMLAMPSAWLNFAVLTFEAALLSFAWHSDILSVQIIITTLIGFQTALTFALNVSFIGIKESLLQLLGAGGEVRDKPIRPPGGALSIGEHVSRQREKRQLWAAPAKGARTGEMAEHARDAEKGEVVPTDAASQEDAGPYLAANKEWRPEGARDGSEVDGKSALEAARRLD